MWLNFVILFLFTLSPWLFFAYMPKGNQKQFNLILSFSGSYLFSLTILHILPEIYTSTSQPLLIGAFILAGFFLQLILSFFAQGVEHGHLHSHDHSHVHSLPFSMVLSISVHAFLEGNMLVHPFHAHEVHETHSLMVGMVLHKIPEAFALLSILHNYHTSKWYTFSIFLVYALLSPLGMIFGSYAFVMEWMSPETLRIVFAVIAGNFMHISTIIFFESSPKHELRLPGTIAKIGGAVAAICFELFL